MQTLFVLLQLMYIGFYVGALANLAEIEDLLPPLPKPALALDVLMVTAAILIPVRAFLLSAWLFRPPRLREKLLRMWPFLLIVDLLWFSRHSCCCITSTSDWRFPAQCCWCTPRLRSARWC